MVFKYIILLLLGFEPCLADETHEDIFLKFKKKHQKSKPFVVARNYPKKSSSMEAKRPYKNRYSFGLGVYQNTLYANGQGIGSRAEWVSKENFNLETQYQFKYKDFWLGAKASYDIQNYKPELNPIYTWNEKVPNLFKLSLVSHYETRNLGLGFDFDFHQIPFIYEESFNIELKGVFIWATSLRAQYKWLKTQNWSSRFGLSLNYLILSSDNINLKKGIEYMIFVNLVRNEYWKHNLNMRLYYKFNKYMNNKSNQKENAAGILFSLTSLNWL